jgi:peptide/nickel transport system substrate-binding protein
MVGIVMLLAACAQGAPPPASSGAAQPPQASGNGSATQKTLRIALQGFEEPNANGIISYGSVGGFDPLEHFMLFHASLTVYDQQGTLVPRLAQKVPNLQDGDWKVNADGSMDVTWKLKPGLTWHDGTPLTTSDFAFGVQVTNDPDVPVSRPAWARLVGEVQTPDPQTMVVHWKESSFLGGGVGAGDIPALPTHILADPYKAGDKQAFVNHPYWTTDFIGVGPYKEGRWQRGSFLEGLAFDNYALGRPKIDRILVTYVGDVNAIVAGVLSGDLDTVIMGARLDASQLVAVQDGWKGTGNAGTTLLVPFGVRTVWLQFRDASAPWARDLHVRQALAHSIDRQGMSDALQNGLTPPADTFVPTADLAFQQLDKRGFTKYPFDASRARQLFAEAGWNAGADGMLHDAAGQPLTMAVAATGQGSNIQEIETVANYWQRAGVQASPDPLPPQAANLDERKNTVQGGFLWPWSPSTDAPQNLITTQIPNERTAWKGRNYGGYTNPAYDAIYERFTTTLDFTQRQSVVADAMTLLADQVPVIPIYYYGNGVIVRKGLEGPGMISPLQTSSTWNIETWDIH